MSESFEAKPTSVDGATVLSTFKAALRGMASSVCVITTCDEAGRPHGMAASAVVSVSFDPPSMLISVNESASISERLKSKRAFCINVLTSKHGPIVEAFSNSAMHEHRFASTDWAQGVRGLPYLRTAQASIFCEEDGSLTYGTHTVFIGRVFEVALGDTTGPYVWHNGTRVEIQPAA
ncbi:flavin reductase family protein [Paraburkholderia elongata]|jgi:flavin reductase (DIM6/NTAB) family NADH-FMN oxidoreductase RutF|uniref:Flavin reductase n=1 Tax=Paraburkholderia elongata TaxID=2675747 RepID=A0A972NHR7_9BURK|nr:flavin reductase family protein [Paraburkholderia elongata]NPT53062.1 flavin reductase [Paraburkholderia elongata]